CSDVSVRAATEVSAIAFQAKKLEADGIAAAKILAALELAEVVQFGQKLSAETHLFDLDLVHKIFFDAPRWNIEKYLPFVLTALEKVELDDRNMALATIRAETAEFAPISEEQWKYNILLGVYLSDKYDFVKGLEHNLMMITCMSAFWQARPNKLRSSRSVPTKSKRCD
ncbi:MAG: hypothetical protein F6K28_29635, partial [Microcoleus sp. SIO2G3]|nr:hypothetical protein [Microcoleus sp. SIO2G3]